jgi:hypothetical protein
MRVENKGSSIIYYYNEPPDPAPRPMNSGYLTKKGYKTEPGNVYTKSDIRIHYDGANWWVYYFCAMFRVDTIEQFEKLVIE